MLDSVTQAYPDNSLADDVFFRKATVLQKQGKYDEAAKFYDQVVKNYSWEILADNALYQLALLYENKLNRKEDAKELFKKMMTDYPGSVYVVDSRTEYRKLEGTEPQTENK